MKLQSLAIIFVLIILPISIVLSEYVNIQMDTIKLQTQYDTQLISATYDAVVAYQKNTVNSNFSEITYSKMRDIEASANVFLNSVANNFKLAGNSKEAIREFIPAVVYTLYDGYYIYTPFYNDIDGIELKMQTADNEYTNGKRIFGLKPYIYYSKRYQGSGYDVVITYSLDNFISVQGRVTEGGEVKFINEQGYIIDMNQTAEDGSKYRGVPIKTGSEDIVYEYAGVSDESEIQYKCVKVDGTKYYLENSGNVFYYVQNNKKYLQSGTVSEDNPEGTGTLEEFKEKYFSNNTNMARDYYKEAREFTNRILNQYGLEDIKGENGTAVFADDGEDVEYYSSNFNQERRAVIKESIEDNLALAIANFNSITNTKDISFQMPKLQEDEWDKIINNISVISFLQGINMGTRTYNGYAIVTNNRNEEMVGEESIYITSSDGEYHRINDEDLLNGKTPVQGALNIDFERKTIDKLGSDGSVEAKHYYYPRRETACYDSIITQSGITAMEKKVGGENVPMTVYEFIDEYIKNKNENLASIYYTALGRERQGQNRI